MYFFLGIGRRMYEFVVDATFCYSSAAKFYKTLIIIYYFLFLFMIVLVTKIE